MKSYIITIFLIIVGCIPSLPAEEWKKAQDSYLAKALENKNYKSIFYAIPFDVMPLTKDERAAAIKSERTILIRNQANKVRGLMWRARDGTLRIHFRLTQKYKDGYEFSFSRQDGRDMLRRRFTLRATSKGWEYLEHRPTLPQQQK